MYTAKLYPFGNVFRYISANSNRRVTSNDIDMIFELFKLLLVKEYHRVLGSNLMLNNAVLDF